MPDGSVRLSVSKASIYFCAEWKSPFQHPFLILNGDNEGPVKFGAGVDKLNHLKTYKISHALPDQSPPVPTPFELPDKGHEKIITCGERQAVPGLLWAMMSGRLAAEKITGL